MAEDADKAPQDNEAAEGAEGAAEGDAAAAGKKKKKMMLMISVGVAVVGILVAVAVVFLGGGKHEDAAKKEEATNLPAIAIYDVPEFNLSILSDDPSAPHFIKMKISLELDKPTDTAAVDKLLPRLQDDWGGLLRQMRVSDLQGSANLQRLKENLLRRAQQSLAPVTIKAVYIKEMLVQ